MDRHSCNMFIRQTFATCIFLCSFTKQTRCFGAWIQKTKLSSLHIRVILYGKKCCINRIGQPHNYCWDKHASNSMAILSQLIHKSLKQWCVSISITLLMNSEDLLPLWRCWMILLMQQYFFPLNREHVIVKLTTIFRMTKGQTDISQ